MTVGPFPRKGNENLAGPDLPRIDCGSPDGPVGRMDQPSAGYGGNLGGGQGERPRSRPRLRLAGVSHLSSFAQGTAPDVGGAAHPSGAADEPALCEGLRVGPEGLAVPEALLDRGGIPRLATASVATRRNNW